MKPQESSRDTAMKKLLPPVFVVAAALAVTLSNSIAQAPPAPPPTRLAVCDLVDVFNNYQRAKDLTSQLNERRESIKAEADKRAKAIEALRMELEGLKQGSKEFEQRFNEVQRLTIERTAYLQFQDALAMRDHRNLTKEMYDEIMAMIGAVAKERGYEVVLARENEPLNMENTQEMLRQIGSRKVLYAASSVDLTESIMVRLNQNYKAVKAAPATKPK
jgi:Skp family chaperone for outer membrane proteins